MQWRGRAILLSFWIFSAWYLYIGGLLTQRLNFSEALTSILIANLIFVVIFTFYAGTKKAKDTLFQETFGSSGARYFISLLPALSQIGWYAVVTEIGGSALALALGLVQGTLPFRLTIFCYALFTIWIAQGGLRRIGKLSYVSIPAMVGFSLWGAYAIFHQLGFGGLLNYQPTHSESHDLMFGIQLLFASFVSAAVTIPDFLHDLRSKKEIFLASLWGLIPATLWVGGLGAAFAIAGKDFNVLTTLQLLSGPLFVYVLLSVDNLCGAQAVFPVGTGLASIGKDSKDRGANERRRKLWTLVGGLLAIGLAEFGVVGKLEVWLTVLGTVFAPIIGVILANQYVVKKNFADKKLHIPALFSWLLGCVASLVTVGVPILQALLVAFLTFTVSEKILCCSNTKNRSLEAII